MTSFFKINIQNTAHNFDTLLGFRAAMLLVEKNPDITEISYSEGDLNILSQLIPKDTVWTTVPGRHYSESPGLQNPVFWNNYHFKLGDTVILASNILLKAYSEDSKQTALTKRPSTSFVNPCRLKCLEKYKGINYWAFSDEKELGSNSFVYLVAHSGNFLLTMTLRFACVTFTTEKRIDENRFDILSKPE